MGQERQTLSVTETAKILGIGRNLCYDRVRIGEIPGLRIGHRWLIPKKALEKLLSEGQVVVK